MCSAKFIAIFLELLYKTFLFVSGSEAEIHLEFYPL